jgi:hypothetical protein
VTSCPSGCDLQNEKIGVRGKMRKLVLEGSRRKCTANIFI